MFFFTLLLFDFSTISKHSSDIRTERKIATPFLPHPLINFLFNTQYTPNLTVFDANLVLKSTSSLAQKAFGENYHLSISTLSQQNIPMTIH